MSWSNTYTHTLAIAVDMLTASVFWNKEDITVSSLSGLALRKNRSNSFLGRLGAILNKIQNNHCEQAIASDLNRAKRCIQLLTETN